LKKKPEAEAAALVALKQFGKKKSLVRRYKALTGKEPDIPDPEPVVAVAPTPPASVVPETPSPQQDLPVKQAVPALAPAPESMPAPATIGSETNPHCRFCPN
jgi:hypothetical protein